MSPQRAMRVRLGDWTCPSGNNVEAYYVALGAGLCSLALEWDTPPPLDPADEAFYFGVVRPAVARLVAEYTERPVAWVTV